MMKSKIIKKRPQAVVSLRPRWREPKKSHGQHGQSLRPDDDLKSSKKTTSKAKSSSQMADATEDSAQQHTPMTGKMHIRLSASSSKPSPCTCCPETAQRLE